MNTLISRLNGVFSWILQASWQTAVLAVVVLAVQLIFRSKLSPAWRYGLWVLLVVRLIMPYWPQSTFSIFNVGQRVWLRPAAEPAVSPPAPAPEFTTPGAHGSDPHIPRERPQLRSQSRTSITEPGIVPNAAASAAHQAELKRRTDWFRVASIAWLGGVCLLGLRLFWADFVFRLRLARHTPVSDERTRQLICECASALGVANKVTVIETEAVQSPAVCGLWRKWLLLPDGIFARFSDDELRHIFMHEFAHLKRRDLEVNWLVAILQVLHWFNPLLWFAFARMRADRELATDALALAHARESENVPYGETILKVLEGFTRAAAHPGLVGIIESKSRLKERLREIASRGSSKPWRWVALGLGAVITGVGLTDAQSSKPKNASNQTATATASSPNANRHSEAANTRSSPRTFAIRVIEYDTGTPLAGVNVVYTLKHRGGDSREMEARTADDGRASIQFSAAGLKSLTYQAEKTNYLTIRGEWLDQELSAIENEYQIKLSPGVEIGGTIADEAGKPIVGAEVTFDERMNMLLSAGRPYAEMWTVPSGKHIATTDVNGNWKATCIWPTVQWASLRVHHPDFADATCSTELTSAMEAEGKGVKVSFGDLKEHRVRLTLSRGTKLNGHVVNEAGDPLRGIQVNWAELTVSPHASDRLLGQRIVTTDAAGKFTIAHAPPKHLFFWTQLRDSAPATVEFDPASGPEIELRVAKGVALDAEILDGQNSAPVAGARVSFADFSIWRGIHWEAVTDENGHFEWSSAPSERFQLQIEKDGFITQNKIVQAHANEKLSIRLNRTLHITGNVLDSETKEPVKEFRVDWLDRSDPKDFDEGYPVVTVPGSNGVYALDLGRLYAGTWGGGYAHQCIFRVRADGYATAISRVFSSQKNDVGNVSYDLELAPGSQISGMVLDPNGQPIAEAQVALKLAASRLLLSGKPSLFSTVSGSFQLTDSQGRFHVNMDSGAQGLVAVHEKGFAEIQTNQFSTNVTLKLQPWGRIEGTIWEYGNLVTNQGVWASFANVTWPESLRMEFRTNSDSQGNFAFDFVPAGKFRIYRMIPRESGASSGSAKVVEVRPGATTRIKLGGEGRPVVGRFKITNPYVAVDWRASGNMLYARSTTPQPPKDLKTKEGFDAWRKRPEIQQAYDNHHSYPVQVAADGSFRMDEVVPGQYDVQIQLLDPRDRDAMAYSKYIANTTRSFEVPQPAAGGNGTGPFDVGTFQISLKADFKLGETAAPEFEATDVEGRKFKLSDLHGKYVLLDFWATWCGPCIGEIQYLKQVQEKFKARQDFVIVSLSLDKSIGDLRAFLKKNEMPWTQAYLGDWSTSKVPDAYGVQGIPAVFLVNPEGKLIDSELAGISIIAKLQKHLK